MATVLSRLNQALGDGVVAVNQDNVSKSTGFYGGFFDIALGIGAMASAFATGGLAVPIIFGVGFLIFASGTARLNDIAYPKFSRHVDIIIENSVISYGPRGRAMKGTKSEALIQARAKEIYTELIMSR